MTDSERERGQRAGWTSSERLAAIVNYQRCEEQLDLCGREADYAPKVWERSGIE